MGRSNRRPRSQSGLSSTVGLVSMAVGLLIVAALLLLGTNEFSGTAGSSSAAGGGAAGKTSIFSRSAAETQIKLCSEGRDSTYGNPPSSAQQATCVRMLLSEISTGG